MLCQSSSARGLTPFKDVTERRKEFVVGIVVFVCQSSSARGLTPFKDVTERRKEFVVGILVVFVVNPAPQKALHHSRTSPSGVVVGILDLLFVVNPAPQEALHHSRTSPSGVRN